MKKIVVAFVFLFATTSLASAESNSDVPLVRARLGTQSTSLDGTNYGGFQVGLQLHPTLGKAGTPHLNRLFVGAQFALRFGDTRELSRLGGSIGYQSPDLTGGAVKRLSLAGSLALSMEQYDLFIESPEPGEFEGKGIAPGVIARAQLTYGPVELGFNVELAYLSKAEETITIWGITLGLAVF